VKLIIYFIRARNSLILNCSSGPFLLYVLYYAICWNDGKEENCGKRGGGRDGGN